MFFYFKKKIKKKKKKKKKKKHVGTFASAVENSDIVMMSDDELKHYSTCDA